MENQKRVTFDMIQALPQALYTQLFQATLSEGGEVVTETVILTTSNITKRGSKLIVGVTQLEDTHDDVSAICKADTCVVEMLRNTGEVDRTFIYKIRKDRETVDYQLGHSDGGAVVYEYSFDILSEEAKPSSKTEEAACTHSKMYKSWETGIESWKCPDCGRTASPIDLKTFGR